MQEFKYNDADLDNVLLEDLKRIFYSFQEKYKDKNIIEFDFGEVDFEYFKANQLKKFFDIIKDKYEKKLLEIGKATSFFIKMGRDCKQVPHNEIIEAREILRKNFKVAWEIKEDINYILSMLDRYTDKLELKRSCF